MKVAYRTITKITWQKAKAVLSWLYWQCCVSSRPAYLPRHPHYRFPAPHRTSIFSRSIRVSKSPPLACKELRLTQHVRCWSSMPHLVDQLKQPKVKNCSSLGVEGWSTLLRQRVLQADGSGFGDCPEWLVGSGRLGRSWKLVVPMTTLRG
jgi:hypothetical protein